MFFFLSIASLEKDSTVCYYHIPYIALRCSASATTSKSFSVSISSCLVIFEVFPSLPSGMNRQIGIKAKRNVWTEKLNVQLGGAAPDQ